MKLNHGCEKKFELHYRKCSKFLPSIHQKPGFTTEFSDPFKLDRHGAHGAGLYRTYPHHSSDRGGPSHGRYDPRSHPHGFLPLGHGRRYTRNIYHRSRLQDSRSVGT
ncbi:hypothetical protein AVEN_27593-1 [Araneus ventricosus]|uniref:Uncharacterized protein n=1 Tax=Araneus ventricosus TaxID=182803 RepID=A0A4Y2Q1V7_ARAVE|nr:hypothetical protein AVEN_27593-1 [Araneus ventricosus]